MCLREANVHNIPVREEILNLEGGELHACLHKNKQKNAATFFHIVTLATVIGRVDLASCDGSI